MRDYVEWPFLIVMFVVATLLILRVSVEQASVVMKFAQFDASESPGSMFGQYEEILCG